MSYFNGGILRQMRESRRLSMDAVHALTGVSTPTISKIENGKIDPRMSTVTRLLSCYDASLGDLEPTPPETISLSELEEQRAQNAEELERAGFAPSDPRARLRRKEVLGFDTRTESEALETRA
jgi:transcriptional regulator with XRE-family HTH domain